MIPIHLHELGVSILLGLDVGSPSDEATAAF